MFVMLVDIGLNVDGLTYSCMLVLVLYIAVNPNFMGRPNYKGTSAEIYT